MARKPSPFVFSIGWTLHGMGRIWTEMGREWAAPLRRFRALPSGPIREPTMTVAREAPANAISRRLKLLRFPCPRRQA